HGIPAGRQAHRLAVVAVDLRVEEEVRGQALGLGREDMAAVVGDEQRRGRGLAVLVEHPEPHRVGRTAGEERVDLAAESEVLRALTDIEDQLGLAPARIPRIELHQPVLHRQAPQLGPERRGLHQGPVEPAVGHGVGRRSMQAGRLRAADPKRGGGPGLVVDLDQEGGPAGLGEHRRGRAGRGLHAHLGG
ncbi:MAG: hypothetical protein ACK559_16110, partial [bacterium]